MSALDDRKRWLDHLADCTRCPVDLCDKGEELAAAVRQSMAPGRNLGVGMKLVLSIRVLAGMDVQQFVIPVDLAGPATLKIQPGSFGEGHQISILDEDGSPRMWFAHELAGLRFEGE